MRKRIALSAKPMVCLMASIVLLAGCGRQEFRLVAVGGTVTLDGKALEGARVSFEPMRVGEAIVVGPGSYGLTDRDGRFQLATAEEQAGAVPGPHRVRISTFLAELDPTRENMKVVRPEVVPPHYLADGALTFSVPESGTDAADFELHGDQAAR